MSLRRAMAWEFPSVCSRHEAARMMRMACDLRTVVHSIAADCVRLSIWFVFSSTAERSWTFMSRPPPSFLAAAGPDGPETGLGYLDADGRDCSAFGKPSGT
ncbi:hypothetical protein EVG20_g1748 [Dentipellis fragilis]|uniref:Uncharacterized protein n=1 Tax=Dentipellis fragilis TaxID=205917 RepID=A0A4Y9Z8Q6_9AGAM|nr:hypothetical protein EVG20_g1748 [Dentipellis fragilis]